MRRTVIITGGSAGLGYAAAENLAKSEEWQVVIASRSIERTAAAAAAIGHNVIPMQLDLGLFESVRAFVLDFAARDLPPLHAIVCNAGMTSARLGYTAEGIEQLFGVNHLGHFLLVNLLLPHLREPGRIVFVSSGVHLPENRLARVTGVPVPNYVRAQALAYPDEATGAEVMVNNFQRYSTSKLCNVLCAYEFARRLDGRVIGVFAMDPGLMADTLFVRDFPAPLVAVFRAFFMSLRGVHDNIRDRHTSGKHLARLVTDPALGGRTALYFDGLRERRSSPDSYDVAKQRDLWATSADLTGLREVATV